MVRVAPVALAVAMALGWWVGRLRVRRGVAVAYSRKLFHVGIFTMAAGAHALGAMPAVLAYGATVSLVIVYAVARGPGYPLYEALARPGDAPHRTLLVLLPLVTTALGGLLSNLLFGGTAVVGYLVAGWGDAAGEPAGARWGRHRYPVPGFGEVRAWRSVEGSAAVLIMGSLAAFVALLGLELAPLTRLLAALAAGTAGAVVEAVSPHGLDNLTVQVAAAGVAHLIVH